MSKRDAYLYYEAGQAVAAAHLRLTIRHISPNPASAPTDILLPRDRPKVPIILWLTGMAAEKKGAGYSDPLRRTRNRMRIRKLLQAVSRSGEETGDEAKNLLNQAQDRANAICSNLFQAIDRVVERLRTGEPLPGPEVYAIVQKVKKQRTQDGEELPEEPCKG